MADCSGAVDLHIQGQTLYQSKGWRRVIIWDLFLFWGVVKACSDSACLQKFCQTCANFWIQRLATVMFRNSYFTPSSRNYSSITLKYNEKETWKLWGADGRWWGVVDSQQRQDHQAESGSPPDLWRTTIHFSWEAEERRLNWERLGIGSSRPTKSLFGHLPLREEKSSLWNRLPPSGAFRFAHPPHLGCIFWPVLSSKVMPQPINLPSAGLRG